MILHLLLRNNINSLRQSDKILIKLVPGVPTIYII
jgi:hypothetical protein